MKTPSKRRTLLTGRCGRLAALGTLGVGLALGLAACGGSSASAHTTTTKAGGSRTASFAAYRSCLAAHGVNLPSNFGSGTRPSFPSGSLPTGSFPTGSFPTGSFPTGSSPTGSFPRGTLPAGVSSSQFQAARTACQSKLPSGGFGGRFSSGAGLSAMEAFESCLTSNGVTLNGTGPQALVGIDRSSPTVQAAIKTCSPLLNVGSTTTTTTS